MSQLTKSNGTGYQEPTAVPASDLAKRMGVSLRHVRRMDSMGKIPKPVRIGNSVRWVVSEIDAWLNAGAPDRTTWTAMKGGNGHV